MAALGALQELGLGLVASPCLQRPVIGLVIAALGALLVCLWQGFQDFANLT